MGRRRGAGPGRRWVRRAVRGAVAFLVAQNAALVARMIRDANRHDHRLVHDHAAGDGRGPQRRLVALGDSAAAGFGLTSAIDALPYQVARRLSRVTRGPIHVSCLAVRGYRTNHVRERQVPHLARLRPDIVLVTVGVNDALGRRRASWVHRETCALIDAIRDAAPEALILYCGASDLQHAPGLPRPLAAIVGVACRYVLRAQAAACENRGVAFVTFPAESLSAEVFGPDGFHGGVAGHAIAADLAVAALQRHDLEALRGPAPLRSRVPGDRRDQRTRVRSG